MILLKYKWLIYFIQEYQKIWYFFGYFLQKRSAIQNNIIVRQKGEWKYCSRRTGWRRFTAVSMKRWRRDKWWLWDGRTCCGEYRSRLRRHFWIWIPWFYSQNLAIQGLYRDKLSVIIWTLKSNQFKMTAEAAENLKSELCFLETEFLFFLKNTLSYCSSIWTSSSEHLRLRKEHGR